ncbi:MAG: ABC transporter ATP-binding protein [Acidobacteria bacterium]|nr:ABC transporter ATP-binding protein [Acidobacteriota bacterium]
MLRIENLRKSYGDLTAVDGLSLAVEPGEIYGLLGPNGAGKTTTIAMVCGLARPDAGVVRIDGEDARKDIRRARASLGFVPQDIALYEELNARENLQFWGRLYGLSGRRLAAAIDRVLERVGLADRAKEPIRGYSGGMKRRINLAAALLHEPRLLLLDEPTVGIDPQARLHILDIVRDAAASGAAVLYTTHMLEEAEKLCRRIGIMDHGRLLAEGTLDELIRLVGEGRLLFFRGHFTATRVGEILSAHPDVAPVTLEDGRCLLLVRGNDQSAALIKSMFEAGVPVDDISVKDPSLESLFIKLTGKELRD